jgi:phosphoglycolate phosphatase-like HAD superfamily hydrolase
MDQPDFDLRSTLLEPPAPPPEPPPSQLVPRLLAVLLVAAVIVTGYLVFRPRQAQAPAAPPAESAQTGAPAATALGAESEGVILPPLDESDEAVRKLVRRLSTQPSVVAWLATSSLIRTFTVVVSNIATGERAARHLPALRPKAPFQVDTRGSTLVIDERSYARYLPLATAASSVDPDAAARLYSTLKPRIEEAYRDLGYPDTPFDATLERAITLLLATPVPTAPVRVAVLGGTSYRFADPALEALTPTQKLLIRFGPDNQRAVQASLRRIALALGIAPERLP